ARGDVRAEREADHDSELDGPGVQHRQRPRESKTYGAGVDVRRVAKGQIAAAEHLRPCLQLDVNLEADDGLPAFSRGAHRRASRPSNPIAVSSANAASSIRGS